MKFLSIAFLFVVFMNTVNAGNNTDSLINLAISLVQTKEYNPAYEALERVVIIYQEREQWAEANEVLRYMTRLPIEPSILKKFTALVDQQSLYLKDINPIESSHIYSFLGTWNARNGRFEEALLQFKEAADKLYTLNDTQYLHNVYFWLGQTYQFGKMNGAQALVCANQAERVFNAKKKKDENFIGELYYLKAIAYQSFDVSKAVENFRKAQEIQGDPEGEYESLISKTLTNNKRYDESYAAALKASKFYFDTHNKVNGEYLANEAMILGYLNQFEEALEKLNLAFEYIGDIYAPTESGFIKLYYYKAQILKELGRFDEALNNCQKVYSSFYPKYKSKSNTDIPDISQVTPNHWVLDALEEQGEILVNMYKEAKDSKHLEKAISSFNKALIDLEIRRKEMDNWDSKEQYNKILYSIYEQNLIASAWLYQSNPSFENKNLVLSVLEKSKATLLQENIQIKKGRDNIPVAILDQESDILQSLTELETKILKEENESNIKSLKNELFDTKQKLNNFKKKNSAYYSPSEPTDVVSSHEQNVSNLPENTAVISYHIGDKDILAIGFNKEELHITFTPKNIKFDQNLLIMRRMLSDWNRTLSNRSASEDSIKLYAKNLSNTLLKPLEDFATSPKQLIIMPNGALHNIPFELLPIPGEDQVMIQKYDVSYAYLFSSFTSSENSEPEPSNFAGFAPKYKKDTQNIASQIEEENIGDSKLLALRSGLIDIPEARKSVASLATKYDGASWLGDQATKENFIKEAKNYDVLHLGMHSLLNENTSSLSSLVFTGDTDNELYLREIRSMEIPASLVVLSACNTGVGRNVVGEGPFSLARAFFYAGTESALMSLWQVPDVQTSRIMQLFYGHLEAGLDKNKALSQAKRDYLKTASVLESHPAFWSGFVLVGDTSPLKFNPTESFLFQNSTYLLIGLMVVFLLWILLKKRKVKSI